MIGALDDFSCEVRQDFCQRLLEVPSLIAAVGKELLQEGYILTLPPSCSFRIAMICSSVCLLRFIVWSFLKARLQFILDQFNGAT